MVKMNITNIVNKVWIATRQMNFFWFDSIIWYKIRSREINMVIGFWVKKPYIMVVTYETSNDTRDTWLKRINWWMTNMIKKNGGVHVIGAWTNVMSYWRNQILLLKQADKLIIFLLSETKSNGVLLIDIWSWSRLVRINAIVVVWIDIWNRFVDIRIPMILVTKFHYVTISMTISAISWVIFTMIHTSTSSITLLGLICISKNTMTWLELQLVSSCATK